MERILSPPKYLLLQGFEKHKFLNEMRKKEVRKKPLYVLVYME